jgi:5-formyltetrahydrofolate cyclo-ligase
VIAAKAQARHQARGVRARANAAHNDAPGQVLAQLVSWRDDWHGTVVAGYAALRSELPLWPALAGLAARGATVALPCVQAPELPLQFRAFVAQSELVVDALGIAAPADSAPLTTPTHILLPLLAFDVQGRRLGYGGGYYDRTLAALRQQSVRNGLVLAIGVAYDEQQMAEVPTTALDARLDMVVTPTRLIRCG